jgi:PAS domain-containing protein
MQNQLELISLIIAVVTTFLLWGKKIIRFCNNLLEKRKDYIKKRNDIPYTLQQIQTTLSNVDDRLRSVENEIKPNGGGSMKDALRIVKAEMEASFWLDPRPSFRTTSKGLNILVNESYCHLCGVSSESLLKLNWRNFAEDEDQLDDYTRRWQESSQEFSQFSGKLKIKNYKNQSRGEWVIKIRPLGPLDNNKNEYLWHGTLYPFDYTAIEYAKEQNIPIS